jgi:hypothetical protein
MDPFAELDTLYNHDLSSVDDTELLYYDSQLRICTSSIDIPWYALLATNKFNFLLCYMYVASVAWY